MNGNSFYYNFFVNINRCISEDCYGYFFYRQRSERSMVDNRLKVFLSSNVGDANDDDSFKVQSSEICSFISRYPHLIEYYQIILAVRYKESEVNDWDHSLLRVIIDVDRHLRNVGIVSDLGIGVDCCITFFIIHELDVVMKMKNTKDINEILEDDLSVLSTELGLSFDEEISYNVLREHLQSSINQYDKSLYMLFEELLDAAAARGKICILDYIKKKIIGNYLFHELTVDNSKVSESGSEEMRAIFRIIKYINSELPPAANNGFVARCRNHWNAINAIKSNDIDKEYAGILGRYKEKLQLFSRHISQLNINEGAKDLDKPVLPKADSINCKNSIFGDGKSADERLLVPGQLIAKFKKNMFPYSSLMERWAATYEELMKYVDDINRQLDEYGQALRDLYMNNLREKDAEFEKKRCNKYLVNKSVLIKHCNVAFI